jgi:hypothetical protein
MLCEPQTPTRRRSCGFVLLSLTTAVLADGAAGHGAPEAAHAGGHRARSGVDEAA